jgi:predicted dehydrogenase
MAKKRKAKEVKVAVVGYGGAFNMGRGHLEQMRDAGMAPVAVCDVDRARLEAAERDFPGIQTYASLAALLRKSDAELVTLITPHNLHARQAVQCLKAGRHVVVEKPFAITTAECDAMIAAARRHKRVLTTYHNRHWDGCILQAVKTIRSGAIGEIVRIEAHMGRWGKPGDWWRASRSISGGILYDWGVHLLEYTFQLIDSPIAEVSGFAKRGFWAPRSKWGADTNEDEGFLVVRYADGKWSSLSISSIDSKPKDGQLEITGTQGTYVFSYREHELITHKRGATVTTRRPNPKSQHGRFYENVAAHLAGRSPLAITPEWARRPVHVIDLAVRSAKQGRALRAKYA